MAKYVMKLPDVGEGVVDAEVVEWQVKPGDVVAEDQHLVDVMTDKATVEMTAPVAGTVLKTSGEPGDRIAVGSELIVFETDQEGQGDQSTAAQSDSAATLAEKPAPAQATPQPIEEERPETKQQAPVAAAAVSAGSPHNPIAAPTVRRRAREANVDLALIGGTGRGGRITHQDLDNHIAGNTRQIGATAVPQSNVTPIPIKAEDGVEQIKLIGMRRMIAEKMTLSVRSIPHFTYVEEVDITELESLRQHLNANRAEDQPKLTYLPFIMKAMIKALQSYPQCNSRFDEQAGLIHQYQAVHAGIATQTANGLMVPVVRHAETRDVWDCAAEVQRVSQAARNGKASRDELTGSTITITSLGALGGITSTPVINHPEVAIIAVNKSVQRPMWRDGRVEPRLMMNLSSSFDHRIVDGNDAAQFIQSIRTMLEFPTTIFM